MTAEIDSEIMSTSSTNADKKTKDGGKSSNLDKIMKEVTSNTKKVQAKVASKSAKANKKMTDASAKKAAAATEKVQKKTEDTINKMLGVKKDDKKKEDE